MSKLTWMPAVPALARLIASSITDAHPPLVDVAHGEGADAGGLDVRPLRRTSTSRMPTSAAREPSTIGEKPARFTSEGAPRPSAAASGIPWMFPVGLVSRGVRVGVGVEPDEARASPSVRWKWRASPAIVPIATEWSPPRTTGVAPVSSASPTRSRSVSQTSTISFRYLRRGSPGRLGLLDLHVQVAPVVHVVAERGDLRVHVRHAEGRGPHVDAPAAGAEVEGHADEGHASLRHARSLPTGGTLPTLARPAARAQRRARRLTPP